MCGISGFIDHNQKSSEEVLVKMTDTLYHRGPDGSGYEFFQSNNHQIGLGHRRLSIIDLSETGKQPMNFKHIWITFNGEVYNYNEIKNELIAVQTQSGIEGFRVVMNETNNTAISIDENKLNGRITIVPTRAVEYIAIDFIITNSGVEFV